MTNINNIELQLYDGEQYNAIDIDSKTNFGFNYKTDDYDNPEKIGSSWSFNVSIPPTRRNINFFSHIERIDNFGNTQIQKNIFRLYNNASLYISGNYYITSVDQDGRVNITLNSEINNIYSILNSMYLSDIITTGAEVGDGPNGLVDILAHRLYAQFIVDNQSLIPYVAGLPSDTANANTKCMRNFYDYAYKQNRLFPLNLIQYFVAHQGMYDNFKNEYIMAVDTDLNVEPCESIYRGAAIEVDEVIGGYVAQKQNCGLNSCFLLNMIFQHIEKNTNYKINLDKDFFNDYNYYWRRMYFIQTGFAETTSISQKEIISEKSGTDITPVARPVGQRYSFTRNLLLPTDTHITPAPKQSLNYNLNINIYPYSTDTPSPYFNPKIIWKNVGVDAYVKRSDHSYIDRYALRKSDTEGLLKFIQNHPNIKAGPANIAIGEPLNFNINFSRLINVPDGVTIDQIFIEVFFEADWVEGPRLDVVNGFYCFSDTNIYEANEFQNIKMSDFTVFISDSNTVSKYPGSPVTMSDFFEGVTIGKFLFDYLKLFNLKIFVDENNTIQIMTEKNYFTNKVIDLSNISENKYNKILKKDYDKISLKLTPTGEKNATNYKTKYMMEYDELDVVVTNEQKIIKNNDYFKDIIFSNTLFSSEIVNMYNSFNADLTSKTITFSDKEQTALSNMSLLKSKNEKNKYTTIPIAILNKAENNNTVPFSDAVIYGDGFIHSFFNIIRKDPFFTLQNTINYGDSTTSLLFGKPMMSFSNSETNIETIDNGLYGRFLKNKIKRIYDINEYILEIKPKIHFNHNINDYYRNLYYYNGRYFYLKEIKNLNLNYEQLPTLVIQSIPNIVDFKKQSLQNYMLFVDLYYTFSGNVTNKTIMKYNVIPEESTFAADFGDGTDLTYADAGEYIQLQIFSDMYTWNISCDDPSVIFSATSGGTENMDGLPLSPSNMDTTINITGLSEEKEYNFTITIAEDSYTFTVSTIPQTA